MNLKLEAYRPLMIGVIVFVLVVFTGLATAIRPDVYANDFKELKIETITAGKGTREVKSGDTVKVSYRGTLKDGTEFDKSEEGKPYETQIGVGAVIQGWDEGVIGMKLNEKRRLEIPSSKAYKQQGSGTKIPPNAGLIFEVEVKEFVKEKK